MTIASATLRHVLHRSRENDAAVAKAPNGIHDAAANHERLREVVERARVRGVDRFALGAPRCLAVRAVVRALRQFGRVAEAIALAERTLASTTAARDLFGWTAELVRVELAFPLADAKRPDAFDAALREARHRLEWFHATPHFQRFGGGCGYLSRFDAHRRKGAP